jgi:hypothetical protein
LLSASLSGVADGLGIYSSNALDDLTYDLGCLLGLGGCDTLGDLCRRFGNGCGNSCSYLRGGAGSH